MTAMGLFDRFKKNKGPESIAFRREMAERLAGRRIRYVTERRDGVNDEVIGKDGSLSIRDGRFIVFASSDVLFRCEIDDLRAVVFDKQAFFFQFIQNGLHFIVIKGFAVVAVEFYLQSLVGFFYLS